MADVQPVLFDAEKLVARLNENALSDDETGRKLPPLELGSPVNNPPEYFHGNFYFRAPIVRNYEDCFGDDDEERLGEVEIRGYSLYRVRAEGIGERLILKTTEPLKLKKGVTLPRCRVDLITESETGQASFEATRRADYKRWAGIYWKNETTRDMIPTGWFLADRK